MKHLLALLATAALGCGAGALAGAWKGAEECECPACEDFLHPGSTRPGPTAVELSASARPAGLDSANTGQGIHELDALVRQKEELEAKVRLQDHLLQGAEVELHGTPIPWTHASDPKFRRENYESIVRLAIAEAGAPLEIIAMDCRELPCLVALETPDATLQENPLVGTRVWKERFPGHLMGHDQSYFESKKCEDGTQMRVSALAPFSDEVHLNTSNLDLRITKRRKDLLGSVDCENPSP